MSSLRIGAVAFLALTLAACVSMNIDERDFFYPDARVAAEGIVLATSPLPPGAETVSLTYEKGPIRAAVVSRPGAQRPLILFCGGNLFRISASGGTTAEKLLRFGDVMLWDYPGYGGTAGEADLVDFRSAGTVVAAEARRRADAEGRRLILWGHSLGGVVCGQGAPLARPDVLVLEATTPSARAIVDQQAGLLRPLLRVNLSEGLAAADTPATLRGFAGKVVILEAGRDTTLVPQLSRRLERELREGVSVQRLVFPEAEHTTVGRQPDFMDRLSEALRP